MKRAAITSVILSLAMCAIIYVFLNNQPKPDIDLDLIQLKELSTNNVVPIDYSEKPTVFLLFTSWCPYCNEDAPKIVTLNNKYKDRINVYGINLIYRDDLEEVKKYVDTHGIDYPILLDETGDVHTNFGGTGFPALFFMDTKGKIVDYIVGSTDMMTIERSFQSLLKKSV